MDRSICLWAILLVALSAGTARAENEGLTDLDEATQQKLTAKSFADLGKVADLCESAISKGLDEENKKFAVQLGVSSLVQRAAGAASAIFKIPPDPRWQQLRRFALGDLERALKHDPKHSAAHLLRGRLLALSRTDRDEARKAINSAVELAPDDSAKAEALVARAETTDDANKQLADYDEAVKLAPKEVDIVRARGMFHFTKGNHENAIADLTAAIELDPKSAESYEARGVAQLMLKRLDEAVGSFDKAIELSPKSAGLLLSRARAYALKEQSEKAMSDVNAALKINPGSVQALLLRARLLQIAKEYAKASEDVDAVLKKEPRLVAAIELRASLAAAQGKYDEAIVDLEMLAENDPKDLDTVLQLGFMYSVVKKPRKAIDKFAAVLKVDPENWSGFYGRADALLSLGQHAEAIADYDQAFKHQPENTGILNNLAWVLATSPKDEVRDGKRAIELAAKACELTKYKRPHIISTLAAAYAETGDFDKAIELSKKAVETGDPKTIDQLKAELQSYMNKKPWRELQNVEEEEKQRQAGPRPPEPAE